MIRTASVFALLALSLVACGGSSQEPATPEERVEADEAKLEDMEKEGMGSGSELDAEKVEEDLDAAKAEEAAE